MFDPRDFIVLARELVPGNEARLRTSVSRSYYGCFLTIRDRLGLASDSPQIHQQVVNELRRRRIPSLAGELFRLRRLRNTCDYQTKAEVTLAQAERALRLADFIGVGVARLWTS